MTKNTKKVRIRYLRETIMEDTLILKMTNIIIILWFNIQWYILSSYQKNIVDKNKNNIELSL